MKESPLFLAGAQDTEIPLFAQDQCGAVIVRIFADYWEVSAFLNGHEYSRVR